MAQNTRTLIITDTEGCMHDLAYIPKGMEDVMAYELFDVWNKWQAIKWYWEKSPSMIEEIEEAQLAYNLYNQD